MHTFWTLAREAAALILEIGLAELHPLQLISAMSTLIVMVIMLFTRRIATLQELKTLWLMACATLLLWLACVLILDYAGKDMNQSITLDIPAETSLEDALIEWGTEAGMTVMINTPSVDRIFSKVVHRTFPARQALELLFRGSGLTYTEEGSTVTMQPPSMAPPKPALCLVLPLIPNQQPQPTPNKIRVLLVMVDPRGVIVDKQWLRVDCVLTTERNQRPGPRRPVRAPEAIQNLPRH